MDIPFFRRVTDHADKVDVLTRIRLDNEEMLRRITRIETRLCKLMLANGLTEDGRAQLHQD